MSRKFRTAESETPCEECERYQQVVLPFWWDKPSYKIAREAYEKTGIHKPWCFIKDICPCPDCEGHGLDHKFEGETVKPCKDFRRKDEDVFRRD